MERWDEWVDKEKQHPDSVFIDTLVTFFGKKELIVFIISFLGCQVFLSPGTNH